MATQFETGYTYYCSEFGGFSFELGDEIESGKRMVKIDWRNLPGSAGDESVIWLAANDTIGFIPVRTGCRAYGAPTFSGDGYVKVTPTYRVPSDLLK